MDNLQRITGKIFGATATATGDDPQIGQFGSALAGTYNGTTDVATIQNLAAWSNGFIDSVTPSTQFPPLPEMTGFGKVLSYQQNYLLQKGVAEWDAGTTYYTGDLCKAVGSSTIYESLIDNNLNNALTDINSWNVYSSVSDDRLHALKSYLDNGELLTDAEGLADVKEYAHSTFDRSKFVIIGNPVTENGITTQLNASNYLYVPLVDPSETEFYVELDYICSNANDTSEYLSEYLFWIRGGYTDLCHFEWYSSNMVVFRYGTKGVEIGNIPRSIGTFKFKCRKTTDAISLTILKDGEQIAHASLAATLDDTCSPGNMFIGSNDTNAGFLQPGHFIDLKSFIIKNDGVEVFSGNKTGIDTIKPNDYTVVGSPTISADGVASGFSSSNTIYFSTVANTTSAHDIEIDIKFKLSNNSADTGRILSFGNQGYYYIQERADDIFIQIDTGSFVYRRTLTKVTGGEYDLKWIFDKTNINLDVKINGVQQTISAETLPSTAFGFNMNYTYLGQNPDSTSSYFTGSIDLNAFKIYVDGNLIIQPCLKIPYTLSKTGSKIVDSVYRDRVSDMYEQFGYAPYYTLSDTDFTLPMGELYGMMLNQSTPHIVETYVNGYSWYRVWSADSTGKKWCEQGGRASGTVNGTSGGVEQIALLKSFGNTDYYFNTVVERYSSTDVSKTDDVTLTINAIANNTIDVFLFDVGGNSYTAYFRWEAKGYIS